MGWPGPGRPSIPTLFFPPLEGDFSASGTKVKLCDSLFAVSGHVAARVLTGAIVILNFYLVGWG